MQLNPSTLEQVTAITNLPLVLTSLAAVVCHWRRRQAHPFQAWLWIGLFGSLAIASGMGVFAHGLVLDTTVRKLLWLPINGALGLTVACFVAAGVLDRWGPRPALRALPVLLLLSVGFFCYASFCGEQLPALHPLRRTGHAVLPRGLFDPLHPKPPGGRTLDGHRRGDHHPRGGVAGDARGGAAGWCGLRSQWRLPSRATARTALSADRPADRAWPPAGKGVQFEEHCSRYRRAMMRELGAARLQCGGCGARFDLARSCHLPLLVFRGRFKPLAPVCRESSSRGEV